MMKSLKTKIIFSSVFVIFFFGVLSSIFVFYISANNFREKETEKAVLKLTSFEKQIKGTMDNTMSLLEKIAKNTKIVNYVKNSGIPLQDSEALETLKEYNLEDFFLAVYVILNDGNTVVSTDESFVGKNYGFRDYFIKAQAGEPYIDVVYGVTSKELGYYFSYPIKDESGSVIGVVVIKMAPQVIHSIMDAPEDSSEKIMLVDNYGVIVYCNKPERIYKSLGSLSPENKKIVEEKRFKGLDITPLQYDNIIPYLGESLQDPRIVNFYDDEEKEEEMFLLKRIDNYFFVLIAEETTDVFFTPALQLSELLGVFVLGSIVLSVLFLYLLVSYFFRPLKIFQKAILRRTQGEKGVRIEYKKRDELGLLAENFNNMAESLEKSYEEVEIKVKEQTSELKEREENLEKQQNAILNILEDVEEEKNISTSLADDLKKFKLAVENASDHIVITDAEGVILYANNAVERITGFSNEEVIGKKAGNSILWGGKMDIPFYKKLWKTIKKDKKVFTGEINNKRKNGEEYIALASISPVLDNNGEVVFFVGIERDVTQERLVDQAKTEFVSLASHQLRTPLSAINWYAEMLLNGDAGKLNAEQSQYVEEVYRGNQRMVELVNALLNVSRLELGTFTIEPTKEDLRVIADEAIKEIEIQMAQKKIQFKKKYPKSLPKIDLDKKLTFMIFQNLLSNATKYTPEGGKVNLEILEKDDVLRIEIKDTGMGIPKSQQSKIFTKLFRADNVRKTDTEGTGLGLYIIKKIVEQVGGKIWFDSAEDKGTTFIVELPAGGMKKKTGTKSLS